MLSPDPSPLPPHYNPSPMFGLRTYWGWRGTGALAAEMNASEHDADWWQTVYRNHANPGAFVTID